VKTNCHDSPYTMRLEQVCFFILLTFCLFFTRGHGEENYPSEINCIISNYISISSGQYWKESSVSDIDERLLIDLTRHKIIERNQVISVKLSAVCGNKGKNNCFYVEIWKMTSSADAKRLSDLCSDLYQRKVYLEKPLKGCFAFENFCIWGTVYSYSTQFRVDDELNKIINKCFDCSTIVGEIYRNKQDCDNHYLGGNVKTK